MNAKTPSKFRVGQSVEWHWGKGVAKGKITERFDRRVQRTIKGSKIVRQGSASNPAFMVEQEDGDRVLKLGSELTAN